MSEDNSPPERDVKDYKFQQLCKVQVRQPVQTDDIKGFYSLIDTSSKYGLTFVGVQNGFKVIKTQEFIDHDSRHTSDRLQYVVTDIPLLYTADVGNQVTHVAVSCDGLTLAIGVSLPDRCQLNMYDVRAFTEPVTGSVSPFFVINLGNDDLIDLAWNPSGHTYLVTCQASGKLQLYSITANLEIKATLSSAGAKCVCWSPKGKQLVVGTCDGRLVQYDFDLKEKRKWDYPTSVLNDQSYSVISIVWLSTYTFLAGFLSSTAESSDQPNLVLINGSKDGQTTYENLEDICYGTGESRPKKYFFNFIQQWDMVITGSSNASEIAVMAKHLDQKQTWEHWNLDDSARAECPLTEDYTDTYPLGMAVDLSSQTVISLGDEIFHPPSPLMLILTTAGHIIPYHCMYMHKDAPKITVAPETLTQTGCRQPVAGQTSTPAASQPFGGSAAKNLFGTSTNQSKPLFGSSNQPIGAQSTNKPFTFGSQREAKPLFTGLGQTENQAPFGSKFTTPTTQQDQVADSKPGLFSGSTGSSTFNFSTPASTTSTTKGFGFGETSSVSTAPSAGFGSFALSMTATTTSTDTGAPTFSFGAGLGQPSSPFQAKPTASVASDAVGTKFNSSSITTPSTFNFANKPAGQSAGLGLASPAGLVIGSKPNLPSNQAPVVPPGGPNLLGKPVTSVGFGAVTSQSGFNQGQSASFGLPLASGTSAQPKEKTGIIPTPATGPSSSPSQLHKSTTLTSLTQIAEPEPTTQAQFQPRSPEQAPPPAYPTNQSMRPVATSEATRPKVDDNNQLGDTVDRSFAKSIQEEILHFEKELMDLKTRAGRTECEIGSREDMIRLRTKTEEIGKFCEDIKTTVQEQNKDVQEQTSLCLDMFAMVEECRVRQQLNSDPKYKSLLKSRALDSASAEKLQDLQLQNQALDQGLRDVDMILDSQWDEYQSRKKSLSRRVQAPTNDAIYRVVKSNHNLILAQKSRVKEMEEKLKQLKLYNKTSTWNNTELSQYSTGDTSAMLSSLADSLVESKPVTSTSKVSSDSGGVRRNKLAQLRDHLYHRHVPVVRSTKPENLSMSRLTIQDSTLIRSPQKSQPPAVQKTVSVGADGGQPQISQSLGPGSGQLKTADDKPQAVKPIKQAVPQKPVPTFTGVKSTQNTANSGKSTFAFSQPTGTDTSSAGQFQFTAGGSTGQKFTGFGLGSETTTTSVTVPKVKEINGIKFEDITPSGSENEIETTEEEDDEYDEEEEGESSGESYGAGFGLQYSMTGQGSQITSTPVATKTLTDNVPTPKAQTSSTPVGRKLFGQDESKPAGTFQFGAAMSQDSDISFGSSSSRGKPVFGTSQKSSENKSGETGPLFTAGKNKQAETDAGNQSGELGAGTGFNFGKNTGTGFNFGTADSKTTTTTTGITGLFGNKATSSNGPQAGSSAPSKPFSFGTGSTPVFSASSSSAITPSSTAESTSAGASTTFSSTVTSSDAAGSSDILGQKPASTGTTSTTTTSQTGNKLSFGSSGLFGSSPVVQPSSSTDTASASTVGGLFWKGVAASSASTTGGLFGKGITASSASTALFGQGNTDTTSNLGALLSATDSPSDDATKPSSTDNSQSSTTTQPSTFSFGQSSTSNQASGIFGQSGSSTQPSTFSFGQSATTTQSSTPLFGQTSTSGSSDTGLFGKSSTPSSVASTLGQTTTSSGGGIFGQTTTSSSGGLFGQTTTSSGGGLFGQTTTSSSGGLFGQTTTSSSGGLFGQTTTTSRGGLFGQTTTTSSGGLFGQTTTTSSGGLFGQTTTSSSGGLFGQTTTSSSGGLFGQTTTSSSGGLFGQTSSSSTGGLFGQTTASNTGIFGSQASSGGGLFGKPSSSTAPFGQAQTSSSGGLFGSSTTTTASGPFTTPSTSGSGLFGTSSSASSTSPFGTAVTSSGTGLFGSTSSSAGSFSFGKPAFGQSSSFGQTPSSGSGFGGSGGLFGQSTESSSGGLFAGLGGKPSEEKANTNVFGGGTFGFQTQTSSSGLFGSSSPSTFGASTSGGGGGLFSGGGAGVGSTGFGSTQQPSGSGFGRSGFGAAPAFGGSPAFGSPPRFGSSPGFGGGGFGATPTFGAASPMGGAGGGATFGSASTNSGGGFAGFASAGSPTFGALAQSSDAPTFGSLNSGGNPGFGSPSFGGQQQNQQGFGGNSFGSSPQFTGYRG